MRLTARGRCITFPRRPLVMGIVNINDDSFSGDGCLDVDHSLAHAFALVRDGADIIDVGGESARTNRAPVSIHEENARVLPFIQQFQKRVAAGNFETVDDTQLNPPWLSVNTWRTEVAEMCLAAGGEILNDMGALPTPDNARIAARHHAALVIMHSVGVPKTSHKHLAYEDVMETLTAFFENRIRTALAAGLSLEQIVLDPGIDFAKQREDNLRVFRHTDVLVKSGRPILMPVSRKSVIGHVLQESDPNKRDAGTVACIVRGMEAGAHIFRVHNVRAAVETIRVVHAVQMAGTGIT